MKKLNLTKSNFAGAEVLSRDELRKVMGGDDGSSTGSGGSAYCKSGDACKVYDSDTGETHSGNCGLLGSTLALGCKCRGSFPPKPLIHESACVHRG